MSLTQYLTISLLTLGGFFFFAGSVGLLRFRDAHSRLHALSKADNVGLGLIATGLFFSSNSVSTGLKILVIWLLALFASAVTCFVIAEWEMKHGRRD